MAPLLGVASGRLARVEARLRPGFSAPRDEQEAVYQEGLATANQMLLGALASTTVARQDAASVEFLDRLSRCGRVLGF